MIVVDASVVAAALLDSGANGVWAESVLARGRAGAPALVYAEVVSIIRRFERAGIISADAAALAHEDLLLLPLTVFDYVPFADRAFALRHNLTSYDAWCAAIAEVTGSALATLDQRLANAPGIGCAILSPPG